MTEASDRFDFANPMQGVKSLKVPRTDVDPFTLDEAKLIIKSLTWKMRRNNPSPGLAALELIRAADRISARFASALSTWDTAIIR